MTAYDPNLHPRTGDGRFTVNTHPEPTAGLTALAPEPHPAWVVRDDDGPPMHPEIIDAFTLGDCWALALDIRTITNLPLVFANPDQDDPTYWEHVGVRVPDGRILDINGVHDEASWKERWADPRGSGAGCVYDLSDDAEINEHLSDFIGNDSIAKRLFPHVRSLAIAHIVVKRHLLRVEPEPVSEGRLLA